MTEGDLGQRQFRPTFWASLVTLAALITLVALGSWQWQRLGEKEALIAELKARIAAPVASLPADLSDPDAVRFLKVELAGRYLHDKEMRLTNRVRDKVVGLHIVTPFELTDGRVILVDRGWVPLNLESPETRPDSLLEGPREVTVLLRAGGFSGPEFLRPVNDPSKNTFHWPELPAMTKGLERPIASVFAVVLEREVFDGGSKTHPVADPPGVDFPNNHLQYTMTWYALALVLLVIYILFHYRRERCEAD